MRTRLLSILLVLSAIGSLPAGTRAAVMAIDTPMPPPAWALLQRALLRANDEACQEFYNRYFDERGWLLCVERWGGDDGPDDAIENLMDWPTLHALGGSDDILRLYKKAWEGHLRQYTLARTEKVPFARDGMYYKEFPVMFDWLHNGEGLCVFNLQGLSDPYDARFRQRVRRFAGFYMNEDPDAPNYDARHKIIRSMFTGSRGPLLRKATALDWAGDPIEIGNRFRLGHGERTYQEMLDHFKDYNDIIGDHPQNLLATCLAVNAFMLDHEPKYKQWLLEYVGAWRQRMLDNGGIIPSNVGLDGKIGSSAGGKWYGGVYGWAFSVIVPQTGELAHRNGHDRALHGFMNAYLLTGDDKYLDPWRKQIDLVNSHKKLVNGKAVYPHMYGDKGWYHFTPQKYKHGDLPLYVLSMKSEDRERVADNPWVAYLDGKNPSYPEAALRGDLDRIRLRVAGMRGDTTTPDTRLADDPMRFNPASVESLVRLMLGGLPCGNRGVLLHSRLRYFDPVKRRAGLPDDVAALVEKLSDNSATVTLINLSPLHSREVVVQGGAYGEHQFQSVEIAGKKQAIDTPTVTVRLAPGAGSKLTLSMSRYVNPPALRLPWRG
ncbi:MAG: hypothetical protein FJ271_10695 [Planctomycetes bacterium]|nr:hypothetical protein [Planctomycetota bacterium]